MVHGRMYKRFQKNPPYINSNYLSLEFVKVYSYILIFYTYVKGDLYFLIVTRNKLSTGLLFLFFSIFGGGGGQAIYVACE
jgi:hypothetical protein